MVELVDGSGVRELRSYTLKYVQRNTLECVCVNGCDETMRQLFYRPRVDGPPGVMLEARDTGPGTQGMHGSTRPLLSGKDKGSSPGPRESLSSHWGVSCVSQASLSHRSYMAYNQMEHAKQKR